MKIAIGILAMDMMHSDFATSLIQMLDYSWSKGIKIAILRRGGCYLDDMRNKVVQDVLAQEDAEYLMFLDTDMTFPANTLEVLLGHDKDIVGCNYLRRRPPHNSTVVGLDCRVIGTDHRGLEEVAAVPTGVVLIKREVLKKMEFPWFLTVYRKHEDGKIVQYGEDVTFCLQARNAGIKVWCDHELSLKVSHLGVVGHRIEYANAEDTAG